VAISHEELRQAIEDARSDNERAKLEILWKDMYKFQVNQDGMHTLMQELRVVIDEYEDRLLIAEDDNLAYHSSGDNELHLVFNFPLMRTQHLTPSWIRSNQRERLAALANISQQAWPCNTLGNHDSPRVYNRYGDGLHNDKLARVTLALMLTLRGTPFLYYGEEIGMEDLYLEDISDFRDMLGVWRYHAEIETLGTLPEKALIKAAHFTRDKNRTPMQWSAEPNAGFSPPDVNTWLPIHPNNAFGVNVADQENDPDSLLNFYRRMIAFRKRTPALIAGDYKPMHVEQDDYLVFLRTTEEQSCLVIINMSPEEHVLSFDLPCKVLRILFSSIDRSRFVDSLSNLIITPYEIYVAELS
jgi:alpha-glucosidase